MLSNDQSYVQKKLLTLANYTRKGSKHTPHVSMDITISIAKVSHKLFLQRAKTAMTVYIINMNLHK